MEAVAAAAAAAAFMLDRQPSAETVATSAVAAAGAGGKSAGGGVSGLAEMVRACGRYNVFYHDTCWSSFPMQFMTTMAACYGQQEVSVQEAQLRYPSVAYPKVGSDQQSTYLPCVMYEVCLDPSGDMTFACALNKSTTSTLFCQTAQGRVKSNGTVFLIPQSPLDHLRADGTSLMTTLGLRLDTRKGSGRQLLLVHAESGQPIAASRPFVVLSKVPERSRSRSTSAMATLVPKALADVPGGHVSAELTHRPGNVKSGPFKYLPGKSSEHYRSYLALPEFVSSAPHCVVATSHSPTLALGSTAAAAAGAGISPESKRVENLERRVQSLEQMVLQLMQKLVVQEHGATGSKRQRMDGSYF